MEFNRHTNRIKNANVSKLVSDSFIQPKLSIGPVDDLYEREADHVAEQIVQRKEQSFFFSPSINNISTIQKKCAACESEEEKIQRKEKGSSEIEIPAIVNDVLNTSGKPLDNDIRADVEPKFGYDFSNVKIHTDEVAAKSAQSLNALAYTSGSSIVFNEGQYQPSSQEGKKLLAHELTHVVQQSQSSQTVQRQPKPLQPQPAPPPKAPACPAFPTSGVQVIGSFSNELALVLSSCSGKEVTVDKNSKLQLSTKAVAGAKKNASASASVANVINNKVGIIVDTDPKSLGTTVGAFDHDCPGRQFVNVKNIEAQAKATGVSGGLDTCSAVLHEMEEAVQARTLGAKVTGDDLFKQSHAQATKVENAIRKDAKLPIREGVDGSTVMIGNIDKDHLLILDSMVFGKGKSAKTQINVIICTPTVKSATETVCVNEVKASHVVDGIVTFTNQKEAIKVFNDHASDFGFQKLKTTP
jgi:hypothetical protein